MEVRTNFKRFAIAITVIIAVGILFYFKPWVQPSSEMILIRNVERTITLPEPAERSENDSGKYRDGKGADHYTRYILLYYTKIEDIEVIEKNIVDKGWRKVAETRYEQSLWNYYINTTNSTCVSTNRDPDSTDRLPHSIFISPRAHDGCRGYFER